jgi:hypothetical protein
MAILHSPISARAINIPTTNVNHNRIRSWVNQMVRHSDPLAVTNLVQGGYDMKKEPDIAQLVATFGVDLVEKTKEWVKEEDEKESVVTRKTAVAAAMEEAEKAAAEREERKEEEPEPVATVTELRQPESYTVKQDDVIEGKKVVSITPWLARRGGKKGSTGKVYESRGVLEVTLEDGTVTYRCKFCDHPANPNPRSVKMHAARSHTTAVASEPEPPLLRTEHYEPSDITHPNARAIRKLAHDLVMALDGIENWQSMDAAALADIAAHRIVENRPEQHLSTEPLTDEQVLRRIEALVDRGRLAEMHQQVTRLGEALAEANASRAAAEARAERAVGSLSALREMLNEEPEQS